MVSSSNRQAKATKRAAKIQKESLKAKVLQQKVKTRVDKKDVSNPKASLRETKGKATASKFPYHLSHHLLHNSKLLIG